MAVDVQVVGRFVEQQQVGRVDQRLGQQYSSFHAGRQGLETSAPIEFHPGEDLYDALLALPVRFRVAMFIHEVRDAVCDHVGHASPDIARHILGQQETFKMGSLRTVP